MFLKTNWIEALKMWRLGLGLFLRGRFPLKLEKIKRRDELDRMMRVVDKLNIDELHDEQQKVRHVVTGGHA
jgi:hypothetical protein